MNFPVKADKLDGLVRSFKDTGKPRIELYPSSTWGYPYLVSNILEYDDPISHWCSGYAEKLNSSLVVKIVDAPFNITHYSIRSHYSNDAYMPAWTFEGSNDNVNYDLLHSKDINEELKNSGIGQYKINPQKKSYRYFRIRQTVKTVGGYDGMRVSGIDFFGSFNRSFLLKSRCFKPKPNPFSYLLI